MRVSISWATCGRFIVDVAISAAISFGLSAALWGLIDAAPQGLGLILMYSPLLLLLPWLIIAPFVIVPLYGLVRRRLGYVAGPMVLAIAAHLHSAGVLATREASIAGAIPVERAPTKTDHRMLAVAGGSTSTQCEEACVRILATSDHTIALSYEPVRMQQWVIYTPAAGQICAATDNAVLAIEFASRGYPGRCALTTKAADFGEGLLLRKMEVDQYRHVPDMPAGFRGIVYELHERLAGEDRLLARRITGGMNQTGPQALGIFDKRSARIDSGPPLDERRFLAAATKIPPNLLVEKAQPFPLDEALDEIEKFFGRKEIVSQTRLHTIEDFAEYAWWTAGSPDVWAHTPEVKKHVVRMLASTDESRLKAVLRGIGGMPLNQRIFADDRLFDLTFDPRIDISSLALGVLSNRFRGGQFPPSDELRARAKARLADTGLTTEQHQLMTRISNF
jgi:hypothetical protein